MRAHSFAYRFFIRAELDDRVRDSPKFFECTNIQALHGNLVQVESLRLDHLQPLTKLVYTGLSNGFGSSYADEICGTSNFDLLALLQEELRYSLQPPLGTDYNVHCQLSNKGLV